MRDEETGNDLARILGEFNETNQQGNDTSLNDESNNNHFQLNQNQNPNNNSPVPRNTNNNFEEGNIPQNTDEVSNQSGQNERMNMPIIPNQRNDDSINNSEEQNNRDLNYIEPINNWINFDSTQDNSFNNNPIFNPELYLSQDISPDDSFSNLDLSNIFNIRDQHPFNITSEQFLLAALLLLLSQEDNNNSNSDDESTYQTSSEENDYQDDQTMSLEEDDFISDMRIQLLIFIKENHFMKNVHKREYGKQFLHKKKFTIKENSRNLNPFFLKYNTFGEYVQYFSDNIPHFVSKRLTHIKKRIFIYIKNLINEVIINKNMQLLKVDYRKAIEPVNAKFNLQLLDSKIGSLFIEFQKVENIFEFGHNKGVIDYITQNVEKEALANYLINLNFKSVVKLFIEDERNGLEYYLIIVEQVLTKKFQKMYGELNQHEKNKILSIKNIDEEICRHFKEYFLSIKPRNISPNE